MPNRIIRRSSAVAVRGPRRKTEWFPSADITGFTTLGAATFVVSQSLTAGELAKRPFTVVRTVGSIWITSDQVAASETPFGAVGFIVVSDKAVATGATAIPDPITQEGSDEWFTYTQFAAQGGPLSGRQISEYKFDSRAMRKVEDGEDIVIVVSNAHATAGLDFGIKFRLLVKLA